MKNNYSVYQHVTPDGMYYFGQTNDIKRRWSSNGYRYKGTALEPYIEKFGWDNIKHIVLFENQSKEDALSIEDSLIISGWEKGNCINQQRSGFVSKEEGYFQQYYQQNREKEIEQNRQYYQQNREKKLEQKRDRYQKNRDEILEQSRQYYEEHRDKINEQRRQRYQKNRDKILERQREYRQRKKLEKQLKEVETTLF